MTSLADLRRRWRTDTDTDANPTLVIAGRHDATCRPSSMAFKTRDAWTLSHPSSLKAFKQRFSMMGCKKQSIVHDMRHDGKDEILFGSDGEDAPHVSREKRCQKLPR